MTTEAPSSLGVAALSRLVYQGGDLQPLWAELAGRATADPTDAAALFDLSSILQLTGNRDQGLELQAQALAASALIRCSHGTGEGLSILAIMVGGDMMANTPLDFMVEDSDMTVHALYIDATAPFPEQFPPHDLAFLAIGESEPNQFWLEQIGPIVAGWQGPMLNAAPDRIAALTRDGVCAMFADAPGIVSPPTARIDRAAFQAIGDGIAALETFLPGEAFPIIARPIGSHAGTGLEKLDDPAAVTAYLAAQDAERFYVSPFVDYSGPDGLFRKQRIAFIEGRPFVCHMAISERWMVHYLNAGMDQSAAKRDEEAAFMTDFDQDFAVRHRAAFDALAERIGLDYFAIDCGETKDGRLLLFEADVAMIVHAMDSPELYPYKVPQMRKVFAAFQAMLERAAAG